MAPFQDLHRWGVSSEPEPECFLPYDRPPRHEDQLTRAAMIVMRAVPLARDALLARLRAPTSARLPEPELDMQTNYVMTPALPAKGGDDEPA